MKIKFKSPNPKGIITWLLKAGVRLKLSDGENTIVDKLWAIAKDHPKVKDAIASGMITLLSEKPKPEAKAAAKATTKKTAAKGDDE